MNPRIQMIAITGSIAVAIFVFALIRQRKLREEYALFWLTASIVLLGVSLWRGSIDMAARLFGVAYPPSVLLLAVVVVGFLLAMHYSISLSRLAEHNKRLAQEMALLRIELEAVIAAGGKSARDSTSS
jgi:hypothetical protein